ncbi:hypothetical protein [Ramlibacter alkalitolerans]|jgi:hypothetical protein|uniref:Uncharacterized protein n=1 Tax=Ramlibacter alkalitolerans TaxID=2039631 RepID=A0ABS1JQP8_9BURK|nr:hypothetical protein [Ramlibacter alkalitolerans]MBL0426181.1 hypothetical protein [Ramlibacter alkalitolerans]
MTEADVPVLDAKGLRRLAAAQPRQPCPACAAVRAPGWEALGTSLDRGALRKVATLRQPDVEDPTLEEHHPNGTHGWSPDAPIAPAFFPYNRCDVWQCAQCGRAFLRYTEYGGYYVEERIRELRPELIAGD